MLPINRRLQRTYGTIQTGPPRNPPPHPDYEDLEPFSRIGINDPLLLNYWKWVIRFTLNNLEFDPMCRDIWDTLTFNYPTVREMYNAYLYLCKYLEEHGFNEKVLDILKKMPLMLKKIIDRYTPTQFELKTGLYRRPPINLRL